METKMSSRANHDVFIGSSCDDRTRESFVCHLSAALQRINITVVVEEDDKMNPETRLYLPNKTRVAIDRSKFCVVVLSENFAFSKHSLTTLEEVIKWSHAKPGALVVPVLYGIDRSLVEQLVGKFGEAFAQHEISEPKDRVIEWKKALMEAVHIEEGLVSDNDSSEDPKKRPGLDLCKGLVSLPYELRLLHWENYSLQFLPDDFNPYNLVELNMPYSQLEKLWEDSKNLNSIKTISLHHSEKLVTIEDIVDAENVEVIDLRGCTSLQSFPGTDSLSCLQVLNLCGCVEITTFPKVPTNIKELCLKGTSIREIPTSIEKLLKLVKLDLGNCKKLLNFLVKIYNMESLEWLNLSGCTALKSFPEIPKCVEKLKSLYLSGTPIEELYTSLSNMIGLKELKVSRDLKTPFSLKDLKHFFVTTDVEN